MKFETFLLHGLFIACLAACVLIFGAMLTASPQQVRLSADFSQASSTAHASAAQPLPPADAPAHDG